MIAGPGPRSAAIFLGDLAYGGGERVAIEQARALASRGTVIDVWGLKDDAPDDLAGAFREANPRVRQVEKLASAGRVFTGSSGTATTSSSRRPARGPTARS